MKAIDKLNSSSGYFNNICYKSTSNYGTDISLKDRREDFINKNQTVCQDDCDFINYNYTTQKANCSCKFKFSSFSFADIHINKTKLFGNFKNISNIANLNILKCHKQLFKKESILYNIGFYFTTAIIIFHIITCFIFYLRQYKEIRDKIKDIIFAIKYLKLNKSKKWIRKNELDENNDQVNDEKKMDIMLEEINDKNKNNVSVSDKNKLLFITKKKKKRRRSTKTKNEQAKNLDLKINSDFNSNKDNGVVKPKKKQKKRKKKAASKNDNPKNNIEIFESQSNKLNINKKVKNIMEYNDDEKNLFSYDLAIEYDHRTYCEYYISLMRTKHYLFSAFFYDKDYNSRIIKINLFFKRFIMSYAINALFFNDDTLHEIYENKGSYDFIYELPKIIYSSLIPMVLITVLNKLGLTNDNIIDLKNEK